MRQRKSYLNHANSTRMALCSVLSKLQNSRQRLGCKLPKYTFAADSTGKFRLFKLGQAKFGLMKYRLPRYHPKVLHSLSVLLRCVERMPTSGHLFTAQSPFFCIFMAGLVAYRNEDRLVLRQWFDVIVSRASGRSVSIFVILLSLRAHIAYNETCIERTPNLRNTETILELD